MHSSLLLTQNQGRVLQTFALRRLAATRGHRLVAGVQVKADIPLHLVRTFPNLVPRPHLSPLIVLPAEDMGKDAVANSWALNTTSFIQVALNSVSSHLTMFHVPDKAMRLSIAGAKALMLRKSAASYM